MFIKHLLMESRDRATSSARLSHSSSSGRADLKIKPIWLSMGLNRDDFFLFPNLVHVRHWVREEGNCSMVQNLLHVGHCLFIAVANALTTTHFLEFYGSATYFPVVLTGLGWLLMIGIGFVRMTLLDSEVHRCDLV